MKTKIKILLIILFIGFFITNVNADNITETGSEINDSIKEISYSDYEGIISIKCSDYPEYSKIKLTVNGSSSTLECDRIKPAVNVSKAIYEKKEGLKVLLKAIDDESGLKYSKYIWDNKEDCEKEGIDYKDEEEITLNEEGKHTLYLCAEDKVGNKNLQTFGSSSNKSGGISIPAIDNTEPSIVLEIPNSKKAGEDNFTVKFTLEDNISKDIEYNYKIITNKIIKSGNQKMKSGDTQIDTYSLTDAGENFKIIFTIKDESGNEVITEKEFKIYPADLDENNSSVSVDTNGDKFANSTDKYNYNLILKDKYNNDIYNKNINIIHNIDGYDNGKIINLKYGIDSSSSALNIINSNGNTNVKGKKDFELASYTPGEFTERFKIEMKKWNDNYLDYDDTKIINLITNEKENTFKKPVDFKIELVPSTENPQLDKEQKYKISLNNIGGINSYDNGKLNISETTIINDIEGHEWSGGLESIKNNFDTDLNSDLGFIGTIGTKDNFLKAPSIKSDNLKIMYRLGGNDISYYLDDTEIGGGCDLTTLGLKVIGTIQGEGKSDKTGQEENFSDLSKSTVRTQIIKKAFLAIKNRNSNTTTKINGIMYVEGDVKYSDIENVLDENETIVVKDGNFIINEDINKNIGIIVLKDGYSTISDYNKIGNVYVNNNVKNINALIYADGAFRSANDNGDSYSDDNLQKVLNLNGSLFTNNTIGGAVGYTYTLPGGEVTTNQTLAEVFDLNYVRKVPIDCTLTNDENYSFLIKYNSSTQNNTPKLFGE